MNKSPDDWLNGYGVEPQLGLWSEYMLRRSANLHWQRVDLRRRCLAALATEKAHEALAVWARFQDRLHGPDRLALFDATIASVQKIGGVEYEVARLAVESLGRL